MINTLIQSRCTFEGGTKSLLITERILSGLQPNTLATLERTLFYGNALHSSFPQCYLTPQIPNRPSLDSSFRDKLNQSTRYHTYA